MAAPPRSGAPVEVGVRAAAVRVAVVVGVVPHVHDRVDLA
jgi:hypothetical protein